MIRLDEAGKRAPCGADLDAEPGGYVDVWLSAKPEARRVGEPFLPPLLGAEMHLAVVQAARLDQILGTRARSKRVVKTSELVGAGRPRGPAGR